MGRWAEELPEVIRLYRTTPRKSTGETQFSLAFSSKTVVPVEIGMSMKRINHFDQHANDEEFLLNLMLDEK